MDLTNARRAALLGAMIAAIEADKVADAEAPGAALLAADPSDIDANLLLGLARGLGGGAVAAAALLCVAHRAAPEAPHPCLTLGGLLRRHGRAEEITAHYDATLEHSPADGALRMALADDLQEGGNPQGAIDLLAPILKRRPTPVPAHILMGIALAELGRIAPAIAQFRQALETDSVNAAAWSNLGMLLKIEGRFDEALAAADRAVALAPTAPQIQLNRAIVLLRASRLAEAWEDYDWRLQLPGRNRLPPDRLLPTISTLPKTAPKGRSVLLTHEEGFGDTLQFLRYAPLLAARGFRVLVWAPVPLVRLLRAIPGLEQVISAGEAIPNTDYHCPVFSLPRVFETTLADVPPPLPYAADPVQVAKWRERLPRGGRRIGLVWAGQARPWLPGFAVLDARRSLPLASLAPLACVPDAQFISLQMGDAAKQAAAPPSGLALHDPMSDVTDFADTAAIIDNLNAVVSVDTAIVHLAGSMGKPVLLLDRYDSCWRWFAGRNDSPWYPGLQIFRQAAIGDWGPVIERVAAALGAPGRPRSSD